MSDLKPSFWQMSAELPLRPTFSGELDVDVAIIGGGITGLSLAYLLRHTGLKICVLERNRLGRGTSGLTSAHLSTMWDMGYAEVIKKHDLKHAKAIYSAMSAAIEFVYQVSQLSNNEAEFNFVDGFYFRENVDQEDIEPELNACRQIGQSIIPMNSNFPLSNVQAFGVKTNARFHPVKHMNVMLRKLEEMNIPVFENSPVTSIDRHEIRTDQGTVRAAKIVHATHTPAGFNILQAALKPYRSFLVAGKVPKGFPEGLFVDSADPYHYIRKAGFNHETYLIVGGYDTPVGHGDDGERLQQLRDYAMKKFNISEIAQEWSAQLFEPADGLPMIGKDPTHEGHFVATGFSGDGLTMGTAAALMIADLIIRGSHPWEEYFSPARFSLINKESLKCNLEVGKNFVVDRVHADDVDPKDLKIGEGCVHASLSRPTAFFKREDGSIRSMSAVCPHLKCVVHWNLEQKSFDCPCHASRFNSSGHVIEGPSLSGLELREVK